MFGHNGGGSEIEMSRCFFHSVEARSKEVRSNPSLRCLKPTARNDEVDQARNGRGQD
jgi:hypothetical protein